MQCSNILGLNEDQFSYVVGMNFDGASFPRQAIVRPQAGPASAGASGSNIEVLRGAIVNGPDTAGNYRDNRQRPCATPPPPTRGIPAATPSPALAAWRCWLRMLCFLLCAHRMNVESAVQGVQWCWRAAQCPSLAATGRPS